MFLLAIMSNASGSANRSKIERERFGLVATRTPRGFGVDETRPWGLHENDRSYPESLRPWSWRNQSERDDAGRLSRLRSRLSRLETTLVMIWLMRDGSWMY